MPPGETKYSLPVIALVMSGVGVCTFVTSAVGVVLGIVALLRIRREPQLGGKGLAVAAILLPLAALPFQAGIAAGIILPNVIRAQARAKQLECVTGLRQLWSEEVAFRARTGRWATTFAELDFHAVPRNRYAYVISERQVLPIAVDWAPPDGGATHLDEIRRRGIPVGVQGSDFTAACVGNIDNDPTLDIWTISSADRTDASGTSIPAGTPRNDVNDVVE